VIFALDDPPQRDRYRRLVAIAIFYLGDKDLQSEFPPWRSATRFARSAVCCAVTTVSVLSAFFIRILLHWNTDRSHRGFSMSTSAMAVQLPAGSEINCRRLISKNSNSGFKRTCETNLWKLHWITSTVVEVRVRANSILRRQPVLLAMDVRHGNRFGVRTAGSGVGEAVWSLQGRCRERSFTGEGPSGERFD